MSWSLLGLERSRCKHDCRHTKLDSYEGSIGDKKQIYSGIFKTGEHVKE